MLSLEKMIKKNEDENPDKINIMNFNNSYNQYGSFVNLTSLDRANSQFDNILNWNKN